MNAPTAEKTHPKWLTDEGLSTLNKGYLFKGETVADLYRRVSSHAVKVLKSIPVISVGKSYRLPYDLLAQDLYDALWNGWIGLASPVAANFGTSRGLPVSCYGTHIEDSVSSIYSHLKETAQLTKHGGGIGVYFGEIRPTGSPFGLKQGEQGRSSGVVPWIQGYDLAARTVSQGGVRRGSFAMFLPIDHPDVKQLLLAKDHGKGDPRKFVDSNIGLTVTDSWLHSMLEGDSAKRELFVEVLKTRLVTGSPYLIFIDSVNRANPLAYKERGLWVSTSNLCSEITLHTDDSHTFVCVLSSLNLAHYDAWKNWTGRSGLKLTEIGIYLLEAVMEDFITKASRMTTMGRSLRSARKGRALGLGVMGLHKLYQQRGFPFESEEARSLNTEIFKNMKQDATNASKNLAIAFGEPEWCKGYGQRHTHLLAIAPTRTNAVITSAGSQGIEPIDSNFFIGKQSSGTFIRKNEVLQSVLTGYGRNTLETWESIRDHQGSVQHLDFLSSKAKEVFKTAYEINQYELIKQAADRQPYICQSQSLNLFISPRIKTDDLVKLHLTAWSSKIKSLYYLKTKALNLIDKTKTKSKPTPPTITILTKDGCQYCDKLKHLLASLDLKYKEKDIVLHSEGSKWKTAPQVFIDGQHIGGYQQTAKHFRQKISPQQNKECLACEG